MRCSGPKAGVDCDLDRPRQQWTDGLTVSANIPAPFHHSDNQNRPINEDNNNNTHNIK